MNITDVNTIYGAGVASAYRYSLQELEASLVENGITKGLTLHSEGVFHNFRDGNECTLNDMKNAKITLPVATVNPRGFFGKESNLDKIKSNGFKAVRFFPYIQGWKLNNIVFKEILSINQKFKLPFIINTPYFGDISEIDNGYDFPIIFSKVSSDNITEFICYAKKNPLAFAECSEFKTHYVLKKIIDQVGADRIVFGSNSPRDLAKVAVDFIGNADISDEDKEKIFSLNIEKIL